jgi:hypothetical protein
MHAVSITSTQILDYILVSTSRAQKNEWHESRKA